MEITLAIAAALFFALGTVLQQKVAERVPDDEVMKAGLLVQLAKRPLWFLGIVIDGLGFLCQAAALHFGKLVVVQPLLATSVVFALPLGRLITKRQITKNDLIGAGTVTIGLICFLTLANPQGGVNDATTIAWLVSGAIAAAICLGLVFASRGRMLSPKAALLGTSAGILFSFSAALTLTVTKGLDQGLITIISDWHLYALIAIGWISMTLSQASLQTGALAPAISTQMSLDSLVSIMLGVLIFKEQIHDTIFQTVLAFVGLAVLVAGLLILARSHASQPSP